MANSQVTLDVNPKANAEITLLVESSRLDEGQVASDSFEPYPDCTVAAEVPAGGTNLCFPFRNVAENLGASGFVVLASLLFRWILPKWKKIFIISCVFAVLLDPLFLYIPIINGDSRCLGMDQQLNKAAFALRSITDFSYLVDIIIQFYLVEKIWRSYILVDILAILPLPQTYMQSDAARVEARKHKIKIERKVEEKGPEVSLWLSENLIFIPEAAKDNVKSQIMRKVKQELEDNRDVDVEDILCILPSELQSYINCYMMWTKLKTVPKLQSMDEKVLKAMCKHFKPLRYVANSIIIRENEPLGMMFLIMEGVVKIESSSNDVSATSLEAGNFWGEELLDWVTIPLFPTFLPFSTSTVQAVNDVEARVLMASDLCAVITLFREHFSESVFTPPPDHVRFNRLGLGYLPTVRSALHIERLVESDVEH